MSELLRCPRCGAEIGEVVTFDGVQLLQIGGLVTRFVHGACSSCSKEIHWSIADESLARLLWYCNRAKDVL